MDKTELEAAVYRADKAYTDRLNFWTNEMMTLGPKGVDVWSIEEAANEDMPQYLEKLNEARAALEEYG